MQPGAFSEEEGWRRAVSHLDSTGQERIDTLGAGGVAQDNLIRKL
jgi:hypothetical protein